MDTSNNSYFSARYVAVLIAFCFALVALAASTPARAQVRGKGSPVGPEHYTPTPSATPVVCDTQFADVPMDNGFYNSVHCLVCRGIVRGYACGGDGEPCNANNDPYYRPNLPVTRGQVAKMVSESAGFQNDVSAQTFEDVLPGSTFYLYVERLAQRDVIHGYNCGGDGEPCIAPGNRPYFRLNAHTNRGQLIKIVKKAHDDDEAVATLQQTFTDVPEGSTFYTYVEGLLQDRPGLLRGYPCGTLYRPCDELHRPYLEPNNDVTRGQAAKIIVGEFFPECDPR